MTTPDLTFVLWQVRARGGMTNIMEILQWSPARFEEAFAFANDLQNRDLVKLIYSNFNKNQIVVELTLPGEKLGRRYHSE